VRLVGGQARRSQEFLIERDHCDLAINPLHDVIHPGGRRIAAPKGLGLGLHRMQLIEQLRARRGPTALWDTVGV
jgi:hypothetical protein